MNQDAKKTALRMIPYGIYVLTADDGKGNVAAATVNWVTQTAFTPPLVVVGVKTDFGRLRIVKNTKISPSTCSARRTRASPSPSSSRPRWRTANCPARRSTRAGNGAPILDAAFAAVECKVTSIVEQGDHHIVVAEVIEAHLPNPIPGRPDAAILEMKDLGDNVFYGG